MRLTDDILHLFNILPIKGEILKNKNFYITFYNSLDIVTFIVNFMCLLLDTYNLVGYKEFDSSSLI